MNQIAQASKGEGRDTKHRHECDYEGHSHGHCGRIMCYLSKWSYMWLSDVVIVIAADINCIRGLYGCE